MKEAQLRADTVVDSANCCPFRQKLVANVRLVIPIGIGHLRMRTRHSVKARKMRFWLLFTLNSVQN